MLINFVTKEIGISPPLLFWFLVLLIKNLETDLKTWVQFY